jgi:hypothetical protein
MQFHLNLQVKKFPDQLNLKDKILLMGTCFAENIGAKLKSQKFDVLENPHGILYNPLSISKAIDSYVCGKIYKTEDLFFHNGLWSSWDHHGRFSHPEQEQCLLLINQSQSKAIERVKNLDWLILTTGSSFIYTLKETGNFVGNCHKAPNKIFDKKLLAVSQITEAFEIAISKLMELNPNLKILFTVSPVRYIRDGVVENNLSKAILLQATHQIIDKHKQGNYFPAYELVMDDLRDYRFFKEDMVHPNQQAIDYVWEKFEGACIDPDSLKIMEELNQILKAKKHRPLHPDSPEHLAFRAQNLEKARQLMQRFPFLDLKAEESFFKAE